jgi:serine/threonine protein kinase HipA of HipAB toxin-antitoxin module
LTQINQRQRSKLHQKKSLKNDNHEDTFPGLVENEMLCLQLAQSVGIKTAKTFAKSLRDLPFLVSERYDRTRETLGWYSRLHQEDFCQISGTQSMHKCAIKGGKNSRLGQSLKPSLAIVKHSKRIANSRGAQLLKILSVYARISSSLLLKKFGQD